MNPKVPWNFSPDRLRPLVPQIKAHLISLIYEGNLGPGQKILSIQDFAGHLGVNKKTVEATYKALTAQKLLEIRRPLGYFVSRHIPLLIKSAGTPLAAFPFNLPEQAYESRQTGVPYLQLGSDTSAMVPGSLEKHLREYRKAHKVFNQMPALKPKAIVSYAISQILNYRAMHAEDNQFQIIHGLSMNLYMVVLCLLKQRSCVVMASRQDVRAIAAFQLVKADLFFTGRDNEGMLVDKLEKICERHPVKAVFIRPAAGCPDGLPFSARRRKELIELADRQHFVIIEMYMEHEFWPDSVPITFWETYKKERVIYLSPLSRMTHPLNSMGLVVGPSDFVAAVSNLSKQYSVNDLTSELLVANMVQEGSFSMLLDDMQKHYRKLYSAVSFIIDNYLSGLATYTMPTAGCNVWIMFNEEFNPGPVLAALVDLGLYAPENIDEYHLAKPVKALLIGFCSPSLEKLESGIKLIARAIREESIAELSSCRGG